MLFILGFLFFLGLIFGSFATMWTHRLATGEKGMIAGRSKCPSCEHHLGIIDLIPLFSWIFLGGKCRHCRAKIGWRYPLIELTMGLVFVFCGKFLVPLDGLEVLDIRTFLTLVTALLFAFLCVTISVYDLEHSQVPSALAWWGASIAGGLALIATFYPSLSLLPWHIPSAGWWRLPIVDALLGAGIAWILIGGQALVSRERMMGWGDGDIALFLGAVCGWKLALVAIWFAYMIGGFIGIIQLLSGKRGATPFGQYLCAGFLLALAFGSAVVNHFSDLGDL